MLNSEDWYLEFKNFNVQSSKCTFFKLIDLAVNNMQLQSFEIMAEQHKFFVQSIFQQIAFFQ